MTEEFFDFLILQGAVEPAGVDADTGEMLYSFTDKLKDIDPNLFNRMKENFHKSIMMLWELGFLNIDMLNDSPMAKLTRKAFDPEQVKALPEELQESLKEVMRMTQI